LKARSFRIVVFTLLAAALLIAVVGSNVVIVKAVTTDTVDVLTSIGGSTSPANGTYTYTNDTTQTFTATPVSDDFVFLEWTYSSVSGSFTSIDNPLSLTLNDSAYSVQAIFQPINILPATGTINMATDAIVVVLAGVGGTVSPPPGTYALASASSFYLTAKADSGWVFDHWVIAGTPLNHGVYSLTLTPTNNPYYVDHGYGNTYSYQPVFSPTSTTASPTPTINEFSSASAVILALIMVIVVFGTYAYSKRNKK